MAIFGLGAAGFAISATASPSSADLGYYRKYSCQQLLKEGQKVSARAIALSGDLKKAHTRNDTASIEDTVTVPKFVSDTKPVSGEFDLVRSRLLAIEDASIQSQCSIEFVAPGR
jgi:hypothetical protein